MAKIMELSEVLANQIAAGEVVERPASVVKELIENAIDAHSSQIEIFLEEAGLRKIQVIDNGEGIEDSQVAAAFKRHATSKIHTRADLFRIRSLGFRGEALPSIASVSKVSLETSTGQTGRRIQIEGGKLVTEGAAPLRQGTSITVSDLFFNTPARLKYVKTLQTELANIGDIVNRLAMSHPAISFRLVHDGHQLLKTTGSGDLKQTIAGIYGVATAKQMLPVAGEDLDFKVSGFVSLPSVTRASRNYLSIIINGRYIRNVALNKAIISGYGSKLMVGRYPIAILAIEMDPLLVDVNVHPTKQEVRLSKEAELTDLIIASIQTTLAKQQLIPNATEQLHFKKKNVVKESPTTSIKLDLAGEKLAYDSQKGQFFVPADSLDILVNEPNNLGEQYVNSERLAKDSPTHSITQPDIEWTHVQIEKYQNPFGETEVTEQKGAPTASSTDQATGFPVLEYFGQMHGTYLFAQNEEGLYIIDQHAAQERIKYERFRQEIGQVGQAKQSLLVPIVLEYPASDCLKLRERQPLLAELGIELEEFGSNSFLVREHPTWFTAGQEETILRELLETVLLDKQITIAAFREKTAIMMSCKQSIKANHYLNETQARQLLVDLAKCENPYNCPHGRPVLVQFSNADMERMFKRIQDPH